VQTRPHPLEGKSTDILDKLAINCGNMHNWYYTFVGGKPLLQGPSEGCQQRSYPYVTFFVSKKFFAVLVDIMSESAPLTTLNPLNLHVMHIKHM